MKTYKGIVFFRKGEDISYSGGINSDAFEARDQDEAVLELLSRQDQSVEAGAFEAQVLEVDTNFTPHDSEHYGKRHTLSLRSALLKQAMFEQAAERRPALPTPIADPFAV